MKTPKRIISVFLLFALLAIAPLNLMGCFWNGGGNTTPEETITKTGETTALSAAEKMQAYTGESTSTYYGVGRTVNVITDEYTELSGLYTKIFDPEGLTALNWRRSYQGKVDAYSASGSSMSEFYANLNAKYKKSFSTGMDLGFFSSGFESKFGFSAAASYKNTANEIYFTTSQLFAANLVEIDERTNLSQFTNVLSASFLEDVARLQNKDEKMSAKAFIGKYGTHAVLAGYFGGKIESNYYLKNTGTKWDVDLALSYERNLKASIDKLAGAQAETGFSIGVDLGLSKEETFESFSAYAIGGDNLPALTQADFMANYKDWVASLNNLDVEKSVLVDLPQKSLVAIWDLLPEEYAEAAQMLAGYFEAEARNANSVFLKKYERFYVAPETPVTGDFENFNGGCGTKEDPYLISSREHFENMMKMDSTEKYYKLENDIALENWNDYGKANWKAEVPTPPIAFKGTLDGNSKTVSYTLQIDKTSPMTYAFGLFPATDGAAIKNLNVIADLSTFDPQKRNQEWDISSNDQAQDALVGGIIGYAKDTTMEYCTVSGKIKYNSDAGISDTCVGGAIGYASGGKYTNLSSSAEIYGRGRYLSVAGLIACEYQTTYSNLRFSGSHKAESRYAIFSSFGEIHQSDLIAQTNKMILGK